jgi:hypothetical protein
MLFPNPNDLLDPAFLSSSPGAKEKNARKKKPENCKEKQKKNNPKRN